MTIYGRLSKEHRWTFDTLTSNQIGDEYYVDSILGHHYTMNYKTDQMRLEASVQLMTDRLDHFSLFARLKVVAGISINELTSISYTESKREEMNSPSYGWLTGYSTIQTEHVDNKAAIRCRY